MKRVETILTVVALIAIITVALAAAPLNPPKSDFLSLLKAGQEIAVKEAGDRFEILLIDDAPLSHKITAVGLDYLIIEDTAEVMESRIPIYSIKSMVTLRTPKE